MRISYSALEAYRTCPLKYKFQEIDRIKTPKSKEAVFGTVLHSTLKFIHTPGIISPTLEQALDYFSRNWNSDVFDQEVEERAAFSQGVQIIQDYYKKNNPANFNIVDLESRFAIELDPEEKNNNHIISGVIDRIDKTENGWEIIDYKTAKKMPTQEKVDNDLQLSVYLKAFLRRYPKEIENIDKIKVSLYYLKHGVKLTATRTLEQLKKTDELFLETIKKIEEGKFEAQVNPLCDWCGFQNLCPMWKHKFKDQRKIDSEEVNTAIKEYIDNKNQIASLKTKLEELQDKISQYMDQEGVERVFGENGLIARTLRKTYKYDENKIKEILAPLGKWENVVKVDGIALKNIMPVLPMEAREEIDRAKIVDKQSKSFSVKKNSE